MTHSHAHSSEMKSHLYKGWIELARPLMKAIGHNPLLIPIHEKFRRLVAYGKMEDGEGERASAKTVHVLRSEYDQLICQTLDILNGDAPDRLHEATVHFWENFLTIQHGMYPEDIRRIEEFLGSAKTSLTGFEIPDERHLKSDDYYHTDKTGFNYILGRGRS